MKYTPVIGLEVHIELKTKSKMFCGCSNDYFGQKPNTHTCPVCLGLPGALPVPNKKAIDWCVMTGTALNCQIPLFSKFDRKHYFYPDLAKGYQISQYDQPFASNGWLKIKDKGLKIKDEEKIIRIRRVHMEEDTGKLIHETINGEKVSLVDFNRSGVPLVEIVTEPDFETAKEVKEYLQKLQQIVRYLGVSNADMEKGEMRLEPNISLRLSAQKNELPSYKVEVKNINSFNFVQDAIDYEIKRQTEILNNGEVPTQETRGFVETGRKTVSQRSKEDAKDYRYFPEPDIPPIRWTENLIRQLADQMPELPDSKLKRFVNQYQLSEYNAEILTRERTIADYFEQCVKDVSNINPPDSGHASSIDIANWIINKKIDIDKILPAELVMQIISSKQISGIGGQELEKILKLILHKNQKVIEDYKSGKKNTLMFLVGQAMRELKGKEKAEKIREKLLSLLR